MLMCSTASASCDADTDIFGARLAQRLHMLYAVLHQLRVMRLHTGTFFGVQDHSLGSGLHQLHVMRQGLHQLRVMLHPAPIYYFGGVYGPCRKAWDICACIYAKTIT